MKLSATKRSLICSVLALILCFTMLVGTTFAWFTDSVTSSNNVIMSGNLDIVLQDWDGSDWQDVEGSSEILDKNALWEPGYSEVVYLRVKNAGTLALKYKLGVSVVSEKPGKNAAGDSFLLSDYIYYDVVDGQKPTFADRATAMANATETTLISRGYAKIDTLDAGTDFEYLAMLIYMPTSVENVANHNGTDVPEINLGFNVVATQNTVEADAFGTDYDAAANQLTKDPSGVYLLFDAQDLMSMNAMLNAPGLFGEWQRTYFKLMADIDMSGYDWLSLDEMFVHFDGNGYTISNLNCLPNSWDDKAGFFAYQGGGCIQNLTLENVTARGSQVGIFAGQTEGADILNCNVAGTNVLVWTGESADAKLGSGVGIYAGLTVESSSDYTGKIFSDATVAIAKTGMTPLWNTDDYAGSLYTNCTPNVAIVDERTDKSGSDLTLNPNNGLLWNGNTVNHKGVYYIFSADDLVKASKSFNLQSSSNEANGATFEFKADIDMSGVDWTPWTVMFVTVNGNGHTVSNLSNSFFGYAGAVKVNDLTLENVKAYGHQAGTFAASVEGGYMNNCFLKGDNSVTYVDKGKDENGVGAILGVSVQANVNVTIAEGATVVLDKGNIADTAKTTYESDLYGYKHTVYATNSGNIVNNGTLKVAVTVSDNNALIAAINNGVSTIKLKAGDYSLRFNNDSAFNLDNTTVIGAEDGVKLTVTKSSENYYGWIRANNVVFENLTLTSDSSAIGASGKATYNNCVVDVSLESASSGKAETYVNNCKLAQFHSSGDYSAGNCYLKECEITRAEYGGGITVYFEDCVIEELISWNTNTVLTGCTVNTIDDSHMTTGSITIN